MKQAREIIKALFDDVHARKAEPSSSLFDGWRRIAGEDISAHSRIVDIRDGTVLIECDHPGWLQMIRLREKALVETMRKRYPSLSIKHIRIFITTDPDGTTQKKDTEGSFALNAPNTDEVENLRDADSGEYREFRKLLARVKRLGSKRRSD